MILGSHVSMSGKDMFLGSVEEALSYGANTFMIYTGAPQNTRRKAISELKIEEALKKMQDEGMNPKDIVVHAPYVVNLANSDKREFAIAFLTEEVKRASAMQARQIVLHPGSHVGIGPEEAIELIADGINQILENTHDSDVLIALETMAGKGTEVGRSFEEIRDIINRIHHKKRIGVCFDTCHTHDAGYDVKFNFDDVLHQFDRIVGKGKITVLHINDSKNERGAGKDRHENIGFGHVGFDALSYIVHHPDFKNIPKILETPYIDVHAPYKEEITMLKSKRFDQHLKLNLSI